MTRMKVICLALASCFAAAPALAIAPHDNPMPAPAASTAQPDNASMSDAEKAFHDFDRNGDGYISQDEISSSQALAEGFESADKDRDGKLDLAEFQALEAGASPDQSLASTVVRPQ